MIGIRCIWCLGICCYGIKKKNIDHCNKKKPRRVTKPQRDIAATQHRALIWEWFLQYQSPAEF